MFAAISARCTGEGTRMQRLFWRIFGRNAVLTPGTLGGARVILAEGCASEQYAWKRCVKRLSRKLKERRVHRFLAEAGFQGADVLQEFGIYPPDERKLFRAMAPKLALCALSERREATAAIFCRRPTEEIFTAAAELSRGVRSITLLSDFESEAVAGLLNREHGVSVLRTEGGLRGAGAVLVYDMPFWFDARLLPENAVIFDFSDGCAELKGIRAEGARFLPRSDEYSEDFLRFPGLVHMLFEIGNLKLSEIEATEVFFLEGKR